MNKWYRPYGFMLLAAMSAQLCGCAQTSGWLANKTGKKAAAESLADSKSKSDAKKTKGKSKDIADAKSDDSKATQVAAKGNKKSGEAEHTKVAAATDAAGSKKSKSRTDANVVEKTLDSIATVKPTKVKSKAAEKDADSDLDSFLAKIETPKAAVKERVKKAADDFDSLSDGVDHTKKSVAQAKKEFAKTTEGFEDELADWAGDNSESKTVTPVNASSESSDGETKSRDTIHADQKSVEAKDDFADDLPDFSFGSVKKAVIKKASDAGLQALCPNADGELADVLKGLDLTNIESLKQGLTQIGQLGAKGAAALPLLQKLLKHDDAFVRTHSALAMVQLKLTSPESIKVVTDSLKSKDAKLRSFGTAVLSEMGPQSNQVLTSLSESLNDKDGQTRLRAAEVLIRHDGFAYPALQSLLSSLKDKNDNVRWLATYSLAELAPESPEAVQGLLKATQDSVPKVRVGAVYALGEIGPFANRATEELQQLQKSTDDDELKAAINSTLPKIAN